MIENAFQHAGKARAPADPAPVIRNEDREFAEGMIAFGPALKRMAQSMTGNSVDAEDLVQETMLSAWRARETFMPGSNIRAWLSTILRNAFLSQLRRRRWTGEWTDQLENSLSTAEEQNACVELKQTLELMRQLPPDQRAALEMIAFECLSYEEASECLCIPLGTVKSRVARARSALGRMSECESASVSRLEQGQNADSPRLPGAWRTAKAEGRPLVIG